MMFDLQAPLKISRHSIQCFGGVWSKNSINYNMPEAKLIHSVSVLTSDRLEVQEGNVMCQNYV
jgi:hypothetical protein